MAENLRIGSRVEVFSVWSGSTGRVGQIVPMPGGRGRTRNGTPQFKYVKFDDNGEVLGFFTRELIRTTKGYPN